MEGREDVICPSLEPVSHSSRSESCRAYPDEGSSSMSVAVSTTQKINMG